MVKIEQKLSHIKLHLDCNTKKFYRRHKDILPADMMFYEGRLISEKEWNRTLKMDALQFKIELFIDNCKDKLKKTYTNVKSWFKSNTK